MSALAKIIVEHYTLAGEGPLSDGVPLYRDDDKSSMPPPPRKSVSSNTTPMRKAKV